MRTSIAGACTSILLIILLLSGCNLSMSSSQPIAAVYDLGGHSGWVASVAWSADGKFLASGSYDTTAKVWDIGSKSTRVTLKDFRGSVVSVAWSRDGKFLATGSVEPGDVLRIWDSASWEAVKQWDPSSEYMIDSLAWSPDGTQLAIGVGDLQVWDVASGQMVAKLEPVGGVHSVTWSPDGKLLAFTSSLDPDRGDEGVVVVWDPSKGDGVATDANTVVLTGHFGLVESVTWSPNGSFLASGGEDSIVKIWDLSKKQNTTDLTGHTDHIRAVSWSPDGRTLASGSSDDTIKIWDVGSSQMKATLPHPNDVLTLAWSPDSTQLASGCDDSNVRVWNVQVP